MNPAIGAKVKLWLPRDEEPFPEIYTVIQTQGVGRCRYCGPDGAVLIRGRLGRQMAIYHAHPDHLVPVAQALSKEKR